MVRGLSGSYGWCFGRLEDGVYGRGEGVRVVVRW